jgi:hypothetical protein
MAITIVNRTVWTTSSSSSPQSATIPSTTAGNTLLVMSITPGIQAAASPTLGSAQMNNPVGRFGSGLAFLTNIAGGQTTLTWKSGDVVPSAVVVYELSPCTQTQSGSVVVAHSNSETGYTLNQSSNSAYFEVIAQNATSGSYNSVSSPWDLDYAVSPLPQSGAGMGSVVYILNTTGAETPTWSVTNGSTDCGVSAIAFTSAGPQVTTLSFQDPSGNPLVGGEVTFRLTTDMSASVGTGPQVSAGIVIKGTLDDTGSITISLWPNTAGSIYIVTAYTAEGQPAWSGSLTVS